ncbi:MAG: imidazole glycerol phosphate synthase subunit HisH [Planctomycetes bacterium]|nr:imidazole glycerol phosphate synthase subunit HisH [Planctomycetota bacterium]
MSRSVAVDVHVVQTGVANLASVEAALARAGARALPTLDPAEVRDSARVLLPGVGAFGQAMAALRAHGLDQALRGRIAADRPTLAICLGLQLLAEASEESPGVSGLGVVPGTVRRLPDGVRVPQLGWNTIEAMPECTWLRSGCVCFANSFALREPPHGWRCAMATHGVRFVAGLERGAIVACQFHPELSGRVGHELLCRFVAAGTRAPC